MSHPPFAGESRKVGERTTLRVDDLDGRVVVVAPATDGERPRVGQGQEVEGQQASQIHGLQRVASCRQMRDPPQPGIQDEEVSGRGCSELAEPRVEEFARPVPGPTEATPILAGRIEDHDLRPVQPRDEGIFARPEARDLSREGYGSGVVERPQGHRLPKPHGAFRDLRGDRDDLLRPQGAGQRRQRGKSPPARHDPHHRLRHLPRQRKRPCGPHPNQGMHHPRAQYAPSLQSRGPDRQRQMSPASSCSGAGRTGACAIGPRSRKTSPMSSRSKARRTSSSVIATSSGSGPPELSYQPRTRSISARCAGPKRLCAAALERCSRRSRAPFLGAHSLEGSGPGHAPVTIVEPVDPLPHLDAPPCEAQDRDLTWSRRQIVRADSRAAEEAPTCPGREARFHGRVEGAGERWRRWVEGIMSFTGTRCRNRPPQWPRPPAGAG